MKNLKIAVFSFLIVALAAIGSAFTGQKFDGSLTGHYNGILQPNGQAPVSGFSTASNWGTGTVDDANCPFSAYVCGYTASWTGTPSPAITNADIVSAVNTKYAALSNNFPTDPYAFTVTINGVSVTITVYLKTPQEP
jgi:hypothetical protein